MSTRACGFLHIFVFALAAFGGAVSPAFADAASLDGPPVGATAPDFTAKNILTNDSIDLSAQRGKLVIVTFWATWCGPCRRELPILEKAQRLIGKDRLTVLAVNFGESSEAHSKIKKIMKDWEISLLSDPRSKISASYGIKAIPHMFLIDRDGKVIANHTGYGDKSVDELCDDINAALRPAEAAGT